jgi:hypothetical protein
MESGDILNLLPGIPRIWMKDGENIELKNACSYFGSFDLKVQSDLKNKCIKADLKCNSDRLPAVITLRLPHPEGLKPSKVTGGNYDGQTESVIIQPFSGSVTVTLVY